MYFFIVLGFYLFSEKILDFRIFTPLDVSYVFVSPSEGGEDLTR